MVENMLIGPHGVQQIYPTKECGTEFYLNVKDPYRGGAYTSRPTAQFNISFGKGSQFPLTKLIDTTYVLQGLVYFNTIGSQYHMLRAGLAEVSA
ncbi:MAG: hypothetical protein WA667_23340 [Candidatus Nitrosopolaris sp.]